MKKRLAFSILVSAISFSTMAAPGEDSATGDAQTATAPTGTVPTATIEPQRPVDKTPKRPIETGAKRSRTDELQEYRSTHFDIRVLGELHQVHSDGLDNYLASEGLDSLRTMNGVAIEAAGNKVMHIFHVPSLRNGGRIAFHQNRVGATDGSTHFARVTYWNMQYLLGVFLVDTDIFRWDINAAAGLGWASVEADMGTRLSRYHGTPIDLAFPARFATSISIGYNVVSLVLEGGYEWGRIPHFTSHTDPGPREPDNFVLDGGFIGAGLSFAGRSKGIL